MNKKLGELLDNILSNIDKGNKEEQKSEVSPSPYKNFNPLLVLKRVQEIAQNYSLAENVSICALSITTVAESMIKKNNNINPADIGVVIMALLARLEELKLITITKRNEKK